LDAHFRSIDSKLSAYENTTLLELVIWKSKIAEQTNGVVDVLDADMKMGCRIDSLSMVDIIIPNVLSFLHGGDDEYNDDDDDDDEDNGDSDDDDDSEEEDDNSDNDDDSDEDDGGD
jgi:cobalamin biosynthesis protein CobT